MESPETNITSRIWLRPALIAALMVFLSAGYIRNDKPGWNVNSQFGLTLALAEEGSFSIDSYHTNPATETGDKAFFEGHFYCDKPPVTPFLGVPGYFAGRTMALAGIVDWSYDDARYWTTWLSVGAMAAVLAGLIAILLGRFGVEPRLAAAAAALWVLATPLYGYSTIFFSYIPACVFAVGGVLLLGTPGSSLAPRTGVRSSPPEPMTESPAIHSEANLGESNNFDEPSKFGARSHGGLRLLFAGFLIGLACWTLQTVALLAIILTIMLVAHTEPRRWVSLWPWAVGGLLGVSGYAFYSLAIFGKVANPYSYEFRPEFKDAMAQGLMGATWPSLRVLWLITFHPYRGLFLLFPATLAAVAGAVWIALKDAPRRAAILPGLLFFAGLLLYNAGYYMWWGGWCYAPRHLIPALPLLAPGLVPLIVKKPRLMLGALALCAAVNLAAVAVDPQAPQGVPTELLLHPERVEWWPTPFVYLVRLAWRGEVMPNWGTALGLGGISSLLPLIAAWGACVALIFRPRRTSGPQG